MTVNKIPNAKNETKKISHEKSQKKEPKKTKEKKRKKEKKTPETNNTNEQNVEVFQGKNRELKNRNNLKIKHLKQNVPKITKHSFHQKFK